MVARKSISKKIRFEVFKRDKFTCQYCGASAPDVILEVDHIQPVSKDGDGDIVNLITACKPCNRGKRDRELSDDTVVKKRKAQLDELQERREQIAMMLDWAREMSNMDDEAADAVITFWNDLVPEYSITDNGKKTIVGLIRKYGLSETLECVKISTSQYIIYGKDGETRRDSVTKAFEYIEKIARNRKNMADKPYLAELYYIRGIVRNRLNYSNNWKILNYLKEAYGVCKDTNILKSIAIESVSWKQWQESMDNLIKESQCQKEE